MTKSTLQEGVREKYVKIYKTPTTLDISPQNRPKGVKMGDPGPWGPRGAQGAQRVGGSAAHIYVWYADLHHVAVGVFLIVRDFVVFQINLLENTPEATTTSTREAFAIWFNETTEYSTNDLLNTKMFKNSNCALGQRFSARDNVPKIPVLEFGARSEWERIRKPRDRI